VDVPASSGRRVPAPLISEELDDSHVRSQFNTRGLIGTFRIGVHEFVPANIGRAIGACGCVTRNGTRHDGRD
jgi:hypothetical protein